MLCKVKSFLRGFSRSQAKLAFETTTIIFYSPLKNFTQYFLLSDRNTDFMLKGLVKFES